MKSVIKIMIVGFTLSVNSPGFSQTASQQHKPAKPGITKEVTSKRRSAPSNVQKVPPPPPPPQYPAPKLTLQSKSGAPVGFDVVSIPESSLQVLADRSADLFEFYSEKFGPLPGVTLRIAEVGKGLEAPPKTPGSVLLTAEEVNDKEFDGTLARAVSSLWWGKAVKMQGNQEDWIQQGLQYFSWLSYVEAKGGANETEGVKDRMAQWAYDLGAKMPIRDMGTLPKGLPEPALQHRQAANAAGIVMNLLRFEMTDGKPDFVFSRFLKTLVQEYREKPLTEAGFEALAEKVGANPKLNFPNFFKFWVESTGYPNPKPNYTTYYLRDKGEYMIEGTVSQSRELLQLPAEIAVKTVDGKVSRFPIEIRGPETSFPDPMRVPAEPAPGGITVESNGALLKPSKTSGTYFISKILAGRELLSNSWELDESKKIVFSKDYAQRAEEKFYEAMNVNGFSCLPYFYVGEIYLMAYRNYDAAATRFFRPATRKDGNPTWCAAWSYLNLGRIKDLSGLHSDAVPEYEAAADLDPDNSLGVRTRAAKYQKEGYKETAEDPLTLLDTRTLPEPSIRRETKGAPPAPKVTKEKVDPGTLRFW